MGKSRKTIIVDNDVWWDVKRRAMEQQVTLSDYIEDCLRNGPGDDSDWKEGTADPPDFLKERIKETAKMGSNGIDPSFLANSKMSPGLAAANSDEAKAFNKQFEDEELKQANERLLAKRVETKKGPVKANAALESFFAPQPKAKWKEK